MPIISIIVPVYNVEKYLDRCVKSILAQTFQDFELILVDDGSKDSSGTMCDVYAENDSRIRVIHKENGGLSSARNAGIDFAKGDLLGFVDSDDFIESDMYELLYKNMIRENADMSVCGLYHYYAGRSPKKNKTIYQVLDTKSAISLVMQRCIDACAVDKLYKKSIFEKIRYPLERSAEDSFIIVELLMRCKVIAYTTEQKYYYYHREHSITTQRCAANGYYVDVVDAWQKNYDLITLHYPDLRDFAKSRLCWAYFLRLSVVMDAGEEYLEQKKKIITFLRKNTLFIFFQSNLPILRKLAVIATSFLGKPMHKIIYAIKNKIMLVNS